MITRARSREPLRLDMSVHVRRGDIVDVSTGDPQEHY